MLEKNNFEAKIILYSMTKSQVASPTEGLQECLKNNTVQDKRMGKVVDIILLSDRIQGQNRRMGY